MVWIEYGRDARSTRRRKRTLNLQVHAPVSRTCHLPLVNTLERATHASDNGRSRGLENKCEINEMLGSRFLPGGQTADQRARRVVLRGEAFAPMRPLSLGSLEAPRARLRRDARCVGVLVGCGTRGGRADVRSVGLRAAERGGEGVRHLVRREVHERVRSALVAHWRKHKMAVVFTPGGLSGCDPLVRRSWPMFLS